jgi:hypothetical protein
MYGSTSRAGRWPLAITLAALVALGACADDERAITAPSAQPIEPNLAVGDIITVTNAKGGTDAGSLRWAVAQTTGGEIIRFDSRLAGSTITLDTTLVIRNAVTIEGPAEQGVTISGGGRGRVIDIAVSQGQPATKLRNLSITGGKLTAGSGAGIHASSPLVVEHSTLWGNEAVTAPAILTLRYTSLMLVNSTVSGNTATEYLGAAIIVGDNSTFDNSTIAYNSQGGIRFSPDHEGVLRNSIVANNGTVPRNCGNLEVIQYQGVNLSNDMTCGDSTVMMIADPKLESLRDNGGPSMTHALAPESPAFNGTMGCALTVDQRYAARDAKCDIGAFESTDATTVTFTVERLASVNPTGSNAVIAGTVKCSRAGDQFGVLVQIEQRGPDKTVVQGTGIINVTCSMSAQPWSALVVPSSGAFRSGSASATATTNQAPSWVVPGSASRSIKLVAPEV